jgi:hypothetical protein
LVTALNRLPWRSLWLYDRPTTAIMTYLFRAGDSSHD